MQGALSPDGTWREADPGTHDETSEAIIMGGHEGGIVGAALGRAAAGVARVLRIVHDPSVVIAPLL
eukprot:3292836-Pyramimonas_sp.AAC.1